MSVTFFNRRREAEAEAKAKAEAEAEEKEAKKPAIKAKKQVIK